MKSGEGDETDAIHQGEFSVDADMDADGSGSVRGMEVGMRSNYGFGAGVKAMGLRAGRGELFHIHPDKLRVD